MDERQFPNVAARYDIVREIGRGSSAEVFLAMDRDTGRRVAIKIFRKELAASVTAARFLREIRYLRSLSHPNILPILDASEQSELLYFVAPYAEGHTLREHLRRTGALALADVLRVVGHLAGAIDYAHAHNIIHRDLKPENILFDGEKAILSDFGIARAIILSSPEEALSSSGVAIGTPSYMSPEQTFLDAPIDGRSDIYALGCVTYEMLAGEVPFPASSQLAQAVAHLTSPPRPLRTVRPDLPQAVEDVVFRAMSKAPGERPGSATAFHDALQQAAQPVADRRSG